MKEKSKVELYERIRRDRRVEETSIRGLARRYEVHRRTVRDALGSAVPTPRKASVRDAPAMGPHRDLVRGWLRAEIVDKVPVKQRHTARRVWQRLTEDHGAQVSESTVRLFVAQVRAELAQVAADVTVVQEHALGAEAEIDFGEFFARIAGSRSSCGCSSCACRPRAARSWSRSLTRLRRRSSRGTCSRSPRSVACQPARSVTTISSLP
jgi:hypothetical protein